MAAATTNTVQVNTVPMGLRATPQSETEIQLEWDALTQVGDESVTHYEVEVSTDNGANWTQLPRISM